jgi:hypothetical protein
MMVSVARAGIGSSSENGNNALPLLPSVWHIAGFPILLSEASAKLHHKAQLWGPGLLKGDLHDVSG